MKAQSLSHLKYLKSRAQLAHFLRTHFYGAWCKMKMRGPLLKIVQNFKLETAEL